MLVASPNANLGKPQILKGLWDSPASPPTSRRSGIIPQATAVIRAIEKGRLRVRTSDLVVFEAVYTLQRSYAVPKAKIAENLLPLLLPGIVLPKKRRYQKVFAIYVEHNIAFADASHSVLMQELGISQVLSFDHEFDRLPGIKRLETPPAQ